jgi:predicted ATPase
MVLSRTVSGNPHEWAKLQKSLEAFGAACSLFSRIAVKKLGKSESSPFQIRVTIAGPPVNLVDVGYGVSQVLPVLVDSVLARTGGTLLLQQPEVHLHPRAQAELATFVASLVKADKKRFVIETHSDYLVDRLCLEVRRGTSLSPKDVSILFFERDKTDVYIHQLSIDENGNILGAPAKYREFFIREEQLMLGIL